MDKSGLADRWRPIHKKLFDDLWRNLTILICLAWVPVPFLVPNLSRSIQFWVGLALALVALAFFVDQLLTRNPLPLQRRRRLAYLFWAQVLLLLVVLQPGLHALGNQHYHPARIPVEDWLKLAAGSALGLIGWPITLNASAQSWQSQCLAAWLQLVIAALLCAWLWDYGRVRLQQWLSDTGPPKRWLVRIHLAGSVVIVGAGLFFVASDWAGWAGFSRSLLPCGLFLAAAGVIVAIWSLKKWRDDPLPIVELPSGGPSSQQSVEDFITRWNGDVRKLRWWIPDLLNRGREYLVPAEDMPAGDEWRQRRDHHAWADSLALHYQDRVVGALVRLLVLVFIGACFYVLAQTQSVSDQVRQNLYFGYGLTILAGFVCYWQGPFFEQRFVDYRMLAEGLRVQFFWRWSGIADQLRKHYPRRRLSEVAAVCHAAEQLDRQAAQAGSSPAANLADALPLVRKQWLDDQAKFFNRARKQRDDQLTMWCRLGCAAYFLGVVAYLLGVPFQLSSVLDASYRLADVQSTVSSAFGLGPLVAGLIVVYLRNLTYAEQRSEYNTMYRVYAERTAELESLLDSPSPNWQKVRELLSELGEEALDENADWSKMLRGRMLEIPTTVATLLKFLNKER